MSIKIRKRKRNNNRYSLFLDIYHKGQRKFEHLNMFLEGNSTADKATLLLAENVRAKRQLELNHDSYGFVSETRRKDDFVTYFRKLVNERPPDRSSWQCTLKKLEDYTGGKVEFQKITPEWLTGFKKLLLNEVSQITAWHYYTNIKYALNRAVKEMIIQNNPCNLVDNIKKPETNREYLTIEEVKKLNETPLGNKEVKDAFIFSCFTGLRYSDIINLKWSNIKNDKLEFRQKKTGGVEYLPLAQTAKKILDEKSISKKDEFVFHIPQKEVTWSNIKRWVNKAEINKRVSFHTARHTFATLSLTMGTDLYTVSKLLGHKSISTTQVYAKIVDEKKVEAVNKLPSL